MGHLFLTVDVETDWGGRLPASRDNCQGIEQSIPKLLTLFEKESIKATFFISTLVAGLYQNLIREIHAAGHEIGSHGHDHIDYSRLSTSQLKYQLQHSKAILENCIESEVIGFRTPQFRLHPELFRTLAQVGYQYDSSMARGKLGNRYRNTSLPGHPYKTPEGLTEFPISKLPLIQKPMGLLWVHHMGFRLFKVLEKISQRDETIVLYLHPFDLLRHKSAHDFGRLISFWYSFKSRGRFDTLRKFIRYYPSTFSQTSMALYLIEGDIHGRRPTNLFR